MNIVAQNYAPTQIFVGLKVCMLMLLASSLLSCGGGGGDNVSIGSGQGSDPVVIDYPLFYVKKPLPTDDNGELVQVDVRDLLSVQFGADLYMRVRVSVSAPEVNLTSGYTQGFGDVRDVSVNHEGTKVLFAMRFGIDPGGNEEDQPVWDIYEYDIPSGALRRVIDDIIYAGEGHDISPQYLPDDRIVFSSTRQSRTVAKLLDAGLTDPNIQQFQALDEDQEEPAFVLHVMDDNGQNLHQISFNQSHDMYASVLANGRIIFSRWDGMGNKNAISLYSANPDGTDMQLLYGADSHATSTVGATVEFLKPSQARDGSVAAFLMPFTGTSGGGDIISINAVDYLNNTQPNLANQGVLTGPAQISVAPAPVSALPGFSQGGRYAAVWPLWDGTDRTLVSWTPCLVEYINPLTGLQDPARPDTEACSVADLTDPMATEADPAYGIWAFDGSTQRPIVLAEQGTIITDIAVAQPRPRPIVIPDADTAGILDPDLLAEEAGILNIRSVYDIDGVDINLPASDYQTVADPEATLADERLARFLRVYRAVGIPGEEILPDFDDAAFGNSPNVGMREIVGYVPIEPDGSVRVKVPADVPISIEVLNKAGHRITPDFPRHQYWLQVRPGEEVTCNGCHQNTPDISHGRADGFAAINQGAPFNGYTFPNTIPIGPDTISADAGETMAMARTRKDPTVLELSTDLVYQDVWTGINTGRMPDIDYSVLYADITATPLPEMFSCVPWAVECRVVINYEEHIQPLWEVTRPVLDALDMPTTDPGTGLEINTRCIDCHSRRYPNFPSIDVNLIGEVVDPVARGQLELTSNASGDEPTHMLSYEELLNGDEFEVLDQGGIIFLLIDDPGGAIDPATDMPLQVPATIGSPLTAQGAYFSPAFFNRFSSTGQHPDWLSTAELRLISEWLDLGAQYYNDPFSSVP
jgi:hypothetical protein